MTADAGSQELERTWRQRADIRVARIVVAAIFLAFPELYIWLTLWTNDVRNAGWIALACALPAWGWLAWRIWTQRVTLARDALVIRNVFQTKRVAVADITAVAFRRGILTVTSRLTGAVPATPEDGRAGERHKIGALGLGSQYWSGRPCPADDAADDIAAAAGLPPLPRRKPVIGRRSAGVLLPAAVAFIVSGQVMSHTHGGLRGVMLGAVLTPVGLMLFWPSVYAAYDHYLRRGWRNRSRPPR